MRGGEEFMGGIVRRDPFRPLFAIPRFIEDLDEAFTQRGLKIRENDKHIIVEAVVAGVSSKDVDIDIEDGVLTIKAEAKEETQNEEETRVSSYKYYYTTALSGGQWDKSEAEVKNGIVTITIPKTEASRPRKIEVKAK